MPQQINLCVPILLTQKRYFSAQTMAQALAVFVVLGGGLCAYWVWSLKSASEGFKQALAARTKEIASLQAAIAAGKAGAGPANTGLVQELQARRAEVQQREKWLLELRRGLFREGFGHSARLQLVAQTIPSQVWLTGIKADDSQLDVSGFTLEPAALNDWVGKLSASRLLQGQKLATVKVEQVEAGALRTVADAAPAAAAAPAMQRPLWSFSLTSALARPAATASGDKP